MLNYIDQKEIVKRIARRRPIWYHGNPTIQIIGNEGEFGYIELDFKDGKPLKWRIFLKNKDMIAVIVEMAVLNFDKMYEEILNERYGV